MGCATWAIPTTTTTPSPTARTRAPLNRFVCRDADTDTCDDCVSGTSAPLDDGTDFDTDGLCNAGDPDDDNDTVPDGQDSAPLNRNVCRDTDGDTCDDCTSGTSNPANDGTDTDTDGLCNAGDPDDDGDGVPDGQDLSPLNRNVCRDTDNDTCDDCTSGTSAPLNDGADFDTDGLCDAGDPDDDNDTVADGQDSSPQDRFVCRDTDSDTCDDCSSGTANPASDGTDTDSDGICNLGDPDDDNDTVPDGQDSAPLNRNVCRDTDSDSCDDCSSGTANPAGDGTDTDSDGLCNLGDPDDDNDAVPDAQDAHPLDKNACRDVDADTCDDCTSGTDVPANDGTDTDTDGLCNLGDPDDDNDTVPDGQDSAPLDRFRCRDTDADTCDDCSGGTANPAGDGLDFDTDGLCDAGDPDDDNDAVPDGQDSNPLNRFVCRDADADTCEDCVSGVANPASDGADFDLDGLCNAGDLDDDNDSVSDAQDGSPQNRFACRDVDADTCDDCSSGTDAPANDGTDTDTDGLCNLGDPDDDNDAVLDAQDSAPTNPNVCRDADADTCDDCSSGTDAPADDGTDSDTDGLCNAGDPDDDNDAVLDAQDSAPTNPNVCRDADADTCDDCSSGTDAPADDGTDSDTDGLCNAGDPDDDNDAVLDAQDTSPLNRFICRDADADTCDDCSSGTDAPADDGTDSDTDGLCNAGDPDDDNDAVPDAQDSSPLDRFVCRDADSDTCEDCVSGVSAPGNDGLDLDADGLCDAGDPDDDGDAVADGQDQSPLDRHLCRDADADTCDDCVSGTDAPGSDGPDFDTDGQCNDGDPDDDNDTVLDAADADPLNRNVCRDADADTCDDCASGTDAPGADGLDTDADGACNAGDPDDDDDTVLDAADSSPLNRFVCRDVDADTCNDCVSGTDAPGADGLDTDADGACNAGDPDDDNDDVDDLNDCSSLDPGVFAVPGEVANVRFAADHVTLQWTSALPSAGSATVHQVLRGSVRQFPVGSGAAETCLGGTSTASMTSSDTPTSGQGFYFLVRAYNFCDVGTYGFRTSGAERLSAACP